MSAVPEKPAVRSESQPTCAVWAVIVTFNARSKALRCLQSLHAPELANLRIVVVDNASTDRTPKAIEADFPTVTILRSTSNTGYTGGNNQGIRLALERGAKYVLILNPDTEVVHPRFVEELVLFMEARPDVGIAGPRVFLRDRSVVQNTVLTPPSLVRNLVHWFRYRLNRDFAHRSGDKIVEAEVLNGVCLLVRAACLQDIGLFDESIFAYLEDADLDFRARQRGWKVMYLPIDSVIHHQATDVYGMTSLVSFLLRRNTVYYLMKAGKRVDAWGYAVLSVALMLARSVLPFKDDTVQGHLEFVRRLVRAFAQILMRQLLDERFGPPYGFWPVWQRGETA